MSIIVVYTIALYQFRHRRDYAASAAAATLIAQHYHIERTYLPFQFRRIYEHSLCTLPLLGFY